MSRSGGKQSTRASGAISVSVGMSVNVWLRREKRAETRLQGPQLGTKDERGVVVRIVGTASLKLKGSSAEGQKGWNVIVAKASPV